MEKFYFTHGSDSKYGGGWTVVEAENIEQAVELYRMLHPDKNGYLDCCTYYWEIRFKDTDMYKNGNFGKRLVESIRVEHTEYNGK